MKNLFGEGRIEFEEIQWHIYAATFMLGLSYTFVADDHVRVDLLYDHFSLTTKAWVDLIGTLVFLIPFIVILIWHSGPFVEDAFITNERSNSPAGLAYRWIIKSALPLGLVLLLFAAVARISRIIAYLSSDTTLTDVDADARQGGVMGMEFYEILCIAMFAGFILLLFSGYPVAWVLGGVSLAAAAAASFLFAEQLSDGFLQPGIQCAAGRRATYLDHHAKLGPGRFTDVHLHGPDA